MCGPYDWLSRNGATQVWGDVGAATGEKNALHCSWGEGKTIQTGVIGCPPVLLQVLLKGPFLFAFRLLVGARRHHRSTLL